VDRVCKEDERTKLGAGGSPLGLQHPPTRSSTGWRPRLRRSPGTSLRSLLRQQVDRVCKEDERTKLGAGGSHLDRNILHPHAHPRPGGRGYDALLEPLFVASCASRWIARVGRMKGPNWEPSAHTWAATSTTHAHPRAGARGYDALLGPLFVASVASRWIACVRRMTKTKLGAERSHLGCNIHNPRSSTAWRPRLRRSPGTSLRSLRRQTVDCVCKEDDEDQTGSRGLTLGRNIHPHAHPRPGGRGYGEPPGHNHRTPRLDWTSSRRRISGASVNGEDGSRRGALYGEGA
jgi:hypothetical protein